MLGYLARRLTATVLLLFVISVMVFAIFFLLAYLTYVCIYAIGGAIIGGLIMGVLNNGMSLLGLGSEVQSFIKGFVLLLAVAFDIFNKRRAANASK